MVYAIVRQAGGSVEIASQPGRGTTVTILLPGAPYAARQKLPAARDTELAGDETVLVVEDEELVRRSLREMLSGCGYHVLEARDGREASLWSRPMPAASTCC